MRTRDVVAHSMLDAALHYARSGWRIIPVHNATATQHGAACSCFRLGNCATPAKHPRIADWVVAASTSGADLYEWWGRWPDANVGIVTDAASGVWAIDVDPRNGGVESMRALIAAHGPISTRVHSTAGGGVHYLLRHPDELAMPSTAGTLGAGIDTRGVGGMIVAPPSLTPTGRYVVLSADAVAEAPGWAVERLSAVVRTRDAASALVLSSAEPVDEAALPQALRSLRAEIVAVDEGRFRRFHQLVAESRRAGLTQGQAVTLLDGWCADVGKFQGRVGAEVARSWSKLDSEWSALDLAPNVSTFGGAPAVTAKQNGHEPGRSILVTTAAEMSVEAVDWLWTDRIPLRSLSLLGGREGIGKSLAAYTIAADVSNGTLDGAFTGQPKDVLIAAAEDSWEHTIVPRLMAAGADLTRIRRVAVLDTGIETELSMPVDLVALEATMQAYDVGLLLLDPLISRLDGKLDTHKDSDVRRALEPLVALANSNGAAVLGVIHVNKTASQDMLTVLMGSRAFAAVARAVLFVLADPEDEGLRLLGQPKSNLGRFDVPTLTFRIENHLATHTPAGRAVYTAKLVWAGESTRSLLDAFSDTAEGASMHTATGEAANWLADYLSIAGGSESSQKVKQDGVRAGHSVDALKRAVSRLGLDVESAGYPRRTFWALPGTTAQVDE